MTVAELITKLSRVDSSRVVVLSSDEEGNSYRLLGSVSDDYQYKDREIGLEKLTAQDRKQGYTDEDMMEGGEPAVILW